MLIPSHTLFGVVALLAGAFVLLRRKGDRLHRLSGWVYAVAMLLLCVGSFWIQDSTPFYKGFGPFHVATIVSLVTLLVGLWAVRYSNGPAEAKAAGHVRSMAWSYVGLVMATGSHFIQPVGLGLRDGLGLTPSVALPLAVALCWGVPPLVAVLTLKRRGKALERRFAMISGGPPRRTEPVSRQAVGGDAAEGA